MQSGFSVHPKASQSFANGAAKESPIIFSGDMCGGENTAQAASVEFVRRRRINYARSRLQAFCRKTRRFSDRLKKPLCEMQSGFCCVFYHLLMTFSAKPGRSFTFSTVPSSSTARPLKTPNT